MDYPRIIQLWKLKHANILSFTLCMSGSFSVKNLKVGLLVDVSICQYIQHFGIRSSTRKVGEFWEIPD